MEKQRGNWEEQDTVYSSNRGSPGRMGRQSHNYKVSQANLVTDWPTEPQNKLPLHTSLKSSKEWLLLHGRPALEKEDIMSLPISQRDGAYSQAPFWEGGLLFVTKLLWGPEK
jgi:hypothetical protein